MQKAEPRLSVTPLRAEGCLGVFELWSQGWPGQTSLPLPLGGFECGQRIQSGPARVSGWAQGPLQTCFSLPGQAFIPTTRTCTLDAGSEAYRCVDTWAVTVSYCAPPVQAQLGV